MAAVVFFRFPGPPPTCRPKTDKDGRRARQRLTRRASSTLPAIFPFQSQIRILFLFLSAGFIPAARAQENNPPTIAGAAPASLESTRLQALVPSLDRLLPVGSKDAPPARPAASTARRTRTPPPRIPDAANAPVAVPVAVSAPALPPVFRADDAPGARIPTSSPDSVPTSTAAPKDGHMPPPVPAEPMIRRVVLSVPVAPDTPAYRRPPEPDPLTAMLLPELIASDGLAAAGDQTPRPGLPPALPGPAPMRDLPPMSDGLVMTAPPLTPPAAPAISAATLMATSMATSTSAPATEWATVAAAGTASPPSLSQPPRLRAAEILAGPGGLAPAPKASSFAAPASSAPVPAPTPVPPLSVVPSPVGVVTFETAPVPWEDWQRVPSVDELPAVPLDAPEAHAASEIHDFPTRRPERAPHYPAQPTAATNDGAPSDNFRGTVEYPSQFNPRRARNRRDAKAPTSASAPASTPAPAAEAVSEPVRRPTRRTASRTAVRSPVPAPAAPTGPMAGDYAVSTGVDEAAALLGRSAPPSEARARPVMNLDADSAVLRPRVSGDAPAFSMPLVTTTTTLVPTTATGAAVATGASAAPMTAGPAVPAADNQTAAEKALADWLNSPVGTPATFMSDAFEVPTGNP